MEIELSQEYRSDTNGDHVIKAELVPVRIELLIDVDQTQTEI